MLFYPAQKKSLFMSFMIEDDFQQPTTNNGIVESLNAIKKL